jgi:hypothetical protein
MSPLPFVGREVIERTLGLMDASPEPAEQVWYALCSEKPPVGRRQRERYFAWFAKARGYKGGNSFGKFILRIRDQALAKCPLPTARRCSPWPRKMWRPRSPPARRSAREFVKAWTLGDLLRASGGGQGPQLRPRQGALHRRAMRAVPPVRRRGRATGRTSPPSAALQPHKDIVEAILDPSKALSEQYASFLFTMKDGSMVGGQIAEENNDHLELITTRYAARGRPSLRATS